MLLNISFCEIDLHIRDIAFLVLYRCVNRVDEPFIRREVELLIALQNLFMQVLVHLHSILLDHLFGGCIVTFRGDALDLSEEFSVETTQPLIVVDLQVMLAVALDDLHLFVGGVLIDPVGYELTVTHVRLLDVLSRFDTHELGHQTVHLLLVVTGFEGFFVGQKA